ncbi:site-specific integrase [Paenibacillus bouchesdurhonensis]|uniref:hypothetical protein n=1 Tax=Paenibacillus bouchesdurhonensis TaxID=1870990 RepID=UPI001900CD86|nr:hypothetical protein [Paenibacillus bouchesdurhonensis]
MLKLEDDVLEDLKTFKTVHGKLTDENETVHPNEDGIIFQNYLGNCMTPSTVRETIRDYCKKAAVEYKAHTVSGINMPYYFRVSASLLYVSRRSGHETIKTTADIAKKIVGDELKKFVSYTKRKI